MLDVLESVIAGLSWVVVLTAMAGVYFLPSIVVLVRRSDTAGAVVVINLFLGWTFVGWVTSLAMAVSGTSSPRHAPSLAYPIRDSYRSVPQLQAYNLSAAPPNGAGSGLNGHASANEVTGS